MSLVDVDITEVVSNIEDTIRDAGQNFYRFEYNFDDNNRELVDVETLTGEYTTRINSVSVSVKTKTSMRILDFITGLIRNKINPIKQDKDLINGRRRTQPPKLVYYENNHCINGYDIDVDMFKHAMFNDSSCTLGMSNLDIFKLTGDGSIKK